MQHCLKPTVAVADEEHQSCLSLPVQKGFSSLCIACICLFALMHIVECYRIYNIRCMACVYVSCDVLIMHRSCEHALMLCYLSHGQFRD